MKLFRILLLVTLVPLSISFTVHKFYVSTTKIEYAQEEQSLQIINKLFIDDIEDVLQERYSDEIRLGAEGETPKDAELLKNYIMQKLIIEVNGSPVVLNYIGHEYNNEEVKTYLEVNNISELKTITIENKMLTEVFEDQQNIINVKKQKRRRSLMLDKDNPKGVLNFD